MARAWRPAGCVHGEQLDREGLPREVPPRQLRVRQLGRSFHRKCYQRFVNTTNLSQLKKAQTFLESILSEIIN